MELVYSTDCFSLYVFEMGFRRESHVIPLGQRFLTYGSGPLLGSNDPFTELPEITEKQRHLQSQFIAVAKLSYEIVTK